MARKTQKVRIPKTLVDLGYCVEVHFDSGKVWRPKRKGIRLCATESGRTLWIVGCSKTIKTSTKDSALYRRWRNRAVDSYRKARVRDTVRALKKIGRVRSIVYGWTDQQERIHHFRKRPLATTDNPGKPTFLKISGGNIKTTSRGITG